MDPALLLFAFSAGALAFFAPCCVGMLPAYIAYAVRPEAGKAEARPSRPASRIALLGLAPLALGTVPLLVRGLGGFGLVPPPVYRVLPTLEASLALLLVGAGLILSALAIGGHLKAATRGVLLGLFATVGVLGSFLIVGAPIAFFARALAPYLAFVSLAVGIALLASGLLVLAGRSFAPGLPALVPDVSRPSGFVKFGLAYGIAGLTCTFPLFLAVVATALAQGGAVEALATFAAYALGKASVLVALTGVTVAGGASLVPRLAPRGRFVERASAAMLVLAGAYMTYYYGRALLLVGI